MEIIGCLLHPPIFKENIMWWLFSKHDSMLMCVDNVPAKDLNYFIRCYPDFYVAKKH